MFRQNRKIGCPEGVTGLQPNRDLPATVTHKNGVGELVNELAKVLLLCGITVGTALGVAGCGSRASAAVGPLVCSMARDTANPQSGGVTPGIPDVSGVTRTGKASFYARRFAHRLMANGRRMDPQGDNAASRTLPLGSTARVINMRTGQSAIVSIADRGPYAKGRIVDLSPATARKIGITRQIGVAEVRVAPISVQLPDGTQKRGTGARETLCRVSST